MPTVIIINVNAMVPMAPIVIIINVTAVAQRNSRFSHATLTQPFPVQSRSQLPRTDRDANRADSRHVLMAMQLVLRYPNPNPNSRFSGCPYLHVPFPFPFPSPLTFRFS